MDRSILFCVAILLYLGIASSTGIWGQTVHPQIPPNLPEHAYAVCRHSVFFYGTLRTDTANARPHLYRMDFATSEIARVLPDEAENSALGGQCLYLAASSDGSTLALVAVAAASTPRTSRIVLLNTHTRAIRELVANNRWNNYPSFSPDGRQIAFFHQAPAEGAKTYVPATLSVANLDNGTVQDLIEVIRKESDDSEPAWSPRGQWIAYSSWLGPTSGSAISMIAASGGLSRRITPLGIHLCRHPQWLDCERIIYCAVGEKGVSGLYGINRDGTGNRILFRGVIVSPPQVNRETAQICFAAIPPDATGKRPARLIVINEHGDRMLGPFGKIFLHRWRL
ncbi:MAG: hypothetical protein N3D11_06790 [Candidatus Sumerlaeia bacterium]|nr:hypothetical protein [Candidatus Sumerlaeia bacterium]